MAAQRFNLQDFLVGLIKFVCGVAIALLVISLAGAATARYFFTQLSTLPERPVYDNDAPAKAERAPTETVAPPPAANPPAAPAAEPKVLFKASVTYGAGLLVRTGAGADHATIDGVDYNETVEVLEESGRWYRVRTRKGVEGWIKGRDNTRRL